MGRKSLSPAGAGQVRGPSFDGADGDRIDHRIVGAVPVGRFARGRGQRPSPWALILQAMRERQRGQIERWRTFAVRRCRNHRSRHRGHRPIHRFRLWVTVLQRFAVQPMRRAAVRHTASCPWPGPTIACATSCRSVSRMSSQDARSTKLTESAMVLVLYRQMPARLVAVSKRKRHHVAGAPVLRWRRAALQHGPRPAASSRRPWGRP